MKNSVPGSHEEHWQLPAQEEKSDTRCGVGAAGEARDTGSVSALGSFLAGRALGLCVEREQGAGARGLGAGF